MIISPELREKLILAMKEGYARRKWKMTRCKMVCSFKGDGNNMVSLHPVYSGSEENKQFFAATPGGQVYLNILNDAAFEQFEQGKEYYVDFTLAE